MTARMILAKPMPSMPSFREIISENGAAFMKAGAKRESPQASRAQNKKLAERMVLNTDLESSRVWLKTKVG